MYILVACCDYVHIQFVDVTFIILDTHRKSPHSLSARHFYILMRRNDYVSENLGHRLRTRNCNISTHRLRRTHVHIPIHTYTHTHSHTHTHTHTHIHTHTHTLTHTHTYAPVLVTTDAHGDVCAHASLRASLSLRSC